MNLMLQFHFDVIAKLKSEALLQYINVAGLRALQLTGEVESQRVWLTARNGKVGVGILVGMPSLKHKVPNVPGPERTMLLPVSIFAQPSINSLPSTGTLLEAEVILDYVDALLARLQVEGLGTIYCDSTVPNLQVEAGVIRYDAVFAAEVARDVIIQVVTPSLTENALLVTLTNHATTPDAEIYYTTDETFPGAIRSLAVASAPPFITPLPFMSPAARSCAGPPTKPTTPAAMSAMPSSHDPKTNRRDAETRRKWTRHCRRFHYASGGCF